MSALVRAFKEAVATTSAVARTTYDTEDLAGFLGALYARGRDAHPKLRVDEEAFGRCLARCGGDRPLSSLDALAIEDLYLTCACLEGVRGAAAAFEAGYRKVIRRAVSRVMAAGGDRDEAEQRVWQHLLVGSDPALAKYPGRVSLAKWVPVVAIRVAISLNRSDSVERRLREKATAEAMGVSPEDLMMRAELRSVIEPAVAGAIRRLPTRDRLIFRLYLVGGMSTRAIGTSLGLTHQAVSKRLMTAREALLEDIRGTVAKQLRIPEDDFSSLMRFVASQLDINISRVLQRK